MTRNSFLVLLFLLFVSACGEVSTSPIEEPQVELSSAQPAVSSWESWSFFIPPMCGSPPLVNTGQLDIHRTARFVSNPDGSTSYRERINSARGTVWDVLGNEYVLQQRSSNHSTSDTNGAQVSLSTFIFKVVPKGSGPVQNLEITLQVTWDPINGLQLSSSWTVVCRGG